MDTIVIITIIVFLFYLELGIYVLLKNIYSKVNRAFFLLCIGLAVWSFSLIFMFSSENVEVITFWKKFGALGWCLVPALVLNFISHLTNLPQKDKFKRILFYVYLIPGILFVYLIFAEHWFLYDVSILVDDAGLYFYNESVYLNVFLVFLYSFVFLVLFMLFQWWRNIEDKIEKLQCIIILGSLIISFVWITVFEILLPLAFDIPMLFTTHIGTFAFIGGIAFSMIKFRLFVVTPSFIADEVTDELKEILFFTDIDANVLKTNYYTQKLTGYNTSEIYGKPIQILFEERKLLEQKIYLALTKTDPVSLETDIQTSKGELIPVKLFILNIKDEFGDILGIAVHGYDHREGLKMKEEIEARKLTEQKLKNKGDILQRLVRERKNELEKSYKDLQVKIANRMRIEEQIKADISEKEVLINEIHNRVISNMNMIISLVNTQTPHNLSLKAFRKLQEFNQRVRSMLLVHDNLYLSLNYSDVDFARFLNSIIDDLLKRYNKNENITIRSNISNAFLDIDYAIPLGLIANELITNALVHAFPKSDAKEKQSSKPTVFINYIFEDNFYHFIVNDNGRSIPGNINIEELQTTGLPLVDILVKEQINGSWSIKTEMGSFVKVVFSAEK